MHKLLPLLLVSSLLLAGCWNTKKDDKADHVVYVPKPIPCKIDKPEKPALPYDAIKKEDSIVDKAKAALAEIERRIGYEKKLEAAIDECNK